MSTTSPRWTKLRTAIGASVIALGLAATAGSASPARADDGHTGWFRHEQAREHARERAREEAREQAFRRHAWLERHRFERAAPPGFHAPIRPWFNR